MRIYARCLLAYLLVSVPLHYYFLRNLSKSMTVELLIFSGCSLEHIQVLFDATAAVVVMLRRAYLSSGVTSSHCTQTKSREREGEKSICNILVIKQCANEMRPKSESKQAKIRVQQACFLFSDRFNCTRALK